ncbi:MAG: hypothetical protein R2710_05520 [Acidimicrobiales bacterium]
MVFFDAVARATVVAVLDPTGSRTFAAITDADTLTALLSDDLVGLSVDLDRSGEVPVAVLRQ